jgi:HEPN domain-containing protein
MNDERQLHMRKAMRLLRSVERRASSDEPEAVASTAYYAMHHAACAVLLHRGETPPKTHSGTSDPMAVLPAPRCMKHLSFAPPATTRQTFGSAGQTRFPLEMPHKVSSLFAAPFSDGVTPGIRSE